MMKHWKIQFVFTLLASLDPDESGRKFARILNLDEIVQSLGVFKGCQLLAETSLVSILYLAEMCQS